MSCCSDQCGHFLRQLRPVRNAHYHHSDAGVFRPAGGIVYFIIGTKVKKPGAILIYSIVRAIMGGYLPYIILFILSGAIAELLLWKMGYGNAKALTVSYVINQVLAAFGSTIIPYAIAAKAMADQMVTDGRQDAILAASQMLQSWVSVALVPV